MRKIKEKKRSKEKEKKTIKSRNSCVDGLTRAAIVAGEVGIYHRLLLLQVCVVVGGGPHLINGKMGGD
jgi:hypothetical protein